MLKNIYIFRHGKTKFTGSRSIFDRPYGKMTETAEILPEAKPALTKMGKYLKDYASDFNVSSPFLRCRQTVAIVGRLAGKNFVFDERLRDINHSVEGVMDVAKRIKSFYEEISAKNLESICICSHGYPIAMLKSLFTKGKVNYLKLLDYPPPGVLIIIKDGKVTQKDFNKAI